MSRQRHRFGLGGFLALAVVVALVITAAGILPFRQIIAQRRSVELAQSQLDALSAENRRLEQQIAALETPQEVERLAREQFGLVMPGEIAFVAVPPPGTEQEPVEDPPEALEEQTPWWRTLWDFLTGRDLVQE